MSKFHKKFKTKKQFQNFIKSSKLKKTSKFHMKLYIKFKIEKKLQNFIKSSKLIQM